MGYNLDIIKQAQLASSITDSASTMTLISGQGVTFLQPRCVAVLSTARTLGPLSTAEHVAVTSRSGDILTIERAVVGTAQAWAAGTFVLGYWSPEHFAEVFSYLTRIEGFLALTLGRSVNGVVRTSGSPGLLVSNPASDNIQVDPGWAMINDQVFNLSSLIADVNPPLAEGIDYTIYAEAPTQLLPDGQVSFITGTSEPANTLKLAEVVSVSAVITVTDFRVFL